MKRLAPRKSTGLICESLRALLVLLLASCAGGAPAPDVKPPNFVIILTDDQGYADLGCFGAKDLRTPNLDRMAREGMRFTDFYVGQAVCTASRAALLTGCYPNRVGLQGALNHQSRIGIGAEETLLPQICRSRGYATAAYGKWHLGCQPEFMPLRRGFDDFFGTPYSNDNGPLHPTMRGLPPFPLYEGEKVVELDPDQRFFTKRITEHAVTFIERNRERPFFLYVPHIMPHVPIHASPAFRGKSARGLYGDVIEELDWSVGEILSALKANGVDDHTFVIFFSDNGPFLSYGTHAGRADPLREGKLTAWDGGMRSPCIVRWPGRTPAGSVCAEPLMAIDLLPTVAGLIGRAVAVEADRRAGHPADPGRAAGRAHPARGAVLLRGRGTAGRPDGGLEAALRARLPDARGPDAVRRQAGKFREHQAHGHGGVGDPRDREPARLPHREHPGGALRRAHGPRRDGGRGGGASRRRSPPGSAGREGAGGPRRHAHGPQGLGRASAGAALG